LKGRGRMKKKVVEKESKTNDKVVKKAKTNKPIKKIKIENVVDEFNEVKETKTVKNKRIISKDYLALLAGDVVLMILVFILNEPDVNTVGVAILSTQLCGYLLSVYLNDNEKLNYLFISLLPMFLTLYLVFALLFR